MNNLAQRHQRDAAIAQQMSVLLRYYNRKSAVSRCSSSNGGQGPAVDDDLVSLDDLTAVNGDDEERVTPSGVTDGIRPLGKGGPKPRVGEDQGELIFRTRPDSRLEVADLAEDYGQRAASVSDPEGLAEQGQKHRPPQGEIPRCG